MIWTGSVELNWRQWYDVNFLIKIVNNFLPFISKFNILESADPVISTLARDTVGLSSRGADPHKKECVTVSQRFSYTNQIAIDMQCNNVGINRLANRNCGLQIASNHRIDCKEKIDRLMLGLWKQLSRIASEKTLRNHASLSQSEEYLMSSCETLLLLMFGVYILIKFTWYKEYTCKRYHVRS